MMWRVVIILFLVDVLGDQPPPSPCPNVFAFETDSRRLKGLITIRTPFKYPKVQLSLRLKLSFTQQLTRKHLGSMSIKGRRMAVYDEGVQIPSGKGGYLDYYIDFAPELPPPTLLSLMVNDQELCDPQEDPANWRHRVSLYYNFTGINGTVKESRTTRSEYPEIEDFKGCGVLSLDDSNDDGVKHFDWPWHVAIFKKRSTGYSYLSTGTLVTNRHIVTTAHSLNSSTPASLSILLGKISIGIFQEKGQQGAKVKQIIIHPDFDTSTYQNDISLIVLDEPVEITNYVRPACFWDGPNTALGDIVGRVGWVSGLKPIETGDSSKELRAIGLPVVSKEDCFQTDKFNELHTEKKTFCAEFRYGSGVCVGESGGGFFQNVVDYRPGQNIWFLRGLLIGAKLADEGVSNEPVVSEGLCVIANYAIMIDITMFGDWLKTRIQST